MNSPSLQTIILYDNYFEVIDQLLLPLKKEYIKVNSLETTYRVIKNMNVRGAPLISIVAIHGLKNSFINDLLSFNNDYNQAVNYLKTNSEYLISSRPTAVNITNDFSLMFSSLCLLIDKTVLGLSRFITDFAMENYNSYVESTIKMSRLAADDILNRLGLKDNSKKINVLTICNTGKLAIPGIGTAFGVIRELHHRGFLNKLYIPETRPYNQGSRLSSFEAIEDGLPGVLITDSTCAFLMKKGEVDCVIVGADRVVKSGATANKIGTYSLAVLAKYHNIPFYVVLPESTIDLKMKSGREIEIEERPSNELKFINGIQLAPSEIETYTPAFDVTPPDLITSIVSERGPYEFDNKNEYDEWEFYTKPMIKQLIIDMKYTNTQDLIKISDVSDGNLNFVYEIKVYESLNDLEKEGRFKYSLCLKQAVPYIKCIGEGYPLSLDRSIFEAESLKFESRLCEELVPKIFYFNKRKSLILMEYLDDHIILRQGLIQGKTYTNLEKIGEFIGKCCFYTSNHYLSPKQMRENVSFWIKNNSLCEITEKYFFSDPFVQAEGNSYHESLKEIVNEIQTDNDLLCKVIQLRRLFIENKEALLHGDIHSGSIMIKEKTEESEESIKVIDSEFSFYGPISFDVGSFIGSLIISYYSKEGDSNEYKDYLIKTIKLFYNSFVSTYNSLWTDDSKRNDSNFPGIYKKNSDLLQLEMKIFHEKVLKESVGIAGIEVIRRIVGTAKTKDFLSISDVELKTRLEGFALKKAVEIIKSMDKIRSIDDFISVFTGKNEKS